MSENVLPLRRRTPRDDIWDSLTDHFGNPRTKTERSMFGRVAAELLEAGATAAETQKACAYVQATFDSPSVNAVPKWFTVAQTQKPQNGSVASGRSCPSCGIVVQPPTTLADHLERCNVIASSE